MRPKQHMGEALQKAVKKSGIKVSELCKRAGLSRSAIYKLYGTDSFCEKTLLKLGYIIGHDFCFDFPELVKIKEEMGYVPDVMAEQEKTKLQEKYRDLIERHAELLRFVLRLSTKYDLSGEGDVAALLSLENPHKKKLKILKKK